MTRETIFDPQFIQMTMGFYDNWMSDGGQIYLREHLSELKYLSGVFNRNIDLITSHNSGIDTIHEGGIDYRSAIGEIICLDHSIKNGSDKILYDLYFKSA